MDLTSALDDSLRYDAEYATRLSNHLPMLLVALHRLGASDERLATASATYAKKLHAMPPLQAWQAGDPWREPLGQPTAWPRFRDLFATWLQEEGAGETLRQALPALMPGCGAAAFHGLIRCAYAVDAAHRAELAHALAYWSSRWLDLGVNGQTDGAEAASAVTSPITSVTTRVTTRATTRGITRAITRASAVASAIPRSRASASASGRQADPAPLLKAAAAVAGVGAAPSGYIAECMHHAAWQPGFEQAISPLRLDEDTLPRLARHAAQMYARSGDFTVLHLVTSAWALRVLLPFVDDLQAALAGYWRAYAAGAASVWGKLELTPAPAPLPWPQIVQRALASDDEHVVKLVHACQQEQQAHGGADDWQRAASRAVMGV